MIIVCATQAAGMLYVNSTVSTKPMGTNDTVFAACTYAYLAYN